MAEQHHLKTFLVTGANTGIGYETAKALAKTGGRVIVGVRSQEKGEETVRSLASETGSEKLSAQIIDLADLSSIRAASERLLGEERLDVLVNNAGLANAKGGKTEDGFDLVMGVNHVGTFALTESLMPILLQTARQKGEARVINLSSAAHQFARRFDPEDLMPEKRGFGRDAYSESKLATLLHVREMARRYGAMGIRAHAVHPGFVNSDFGRKDHFPGLWQLAFTLTKPLQISAEKGAKTTIAAALSDDAAWNNGLYWEKEKPSSPTLPQHPEKIAHKLWEETERLLRDKGFRIDRDDAADKDLSQSARSSSLFPDGL